MREASGDRFHSFVSALEERHLATLRFAEVRRALQALSSLYVERRSRLTRGDALGTAGKRAAFALFYGPLHFLLVREIVRALGAARGAPASILDLGCGTGVGAAAWALEVVEAQKRPAVLGIDVNAWVVEEARFTLAALGVRGSVRRERVERTLGTEILRAGDGSAILAAFVLNELDAEAREKACFGLIEAGDRGARVLVVEPIARRPIPWWDGFAEELKSKGGREDVWRFPVVLPERLRLLDRAAGLDHRELTARTLWLPGFDSPRGRSLS